MQIPSLIVAFKITLGLLQLMKARSPAERSCIAHIGLLALVIMAVAPVVLPRWTVELAADPTMPKRGHAVVTARAAFPSGSVVLTCNGVSRRAEAAAYIGRHQKALAS